jgi:hypothetical protein
MSTWPALPLEEWWDTRQTLHRWTQIIGKIRLALTPLVNHWWNVPLYVTARGLTTSEMPCSGNRTLDMELDFVSHALRIRVSDGGAHDIPLGPRSVADLYAEIFGALDSLHIPCRIWPMPVEIIDDPIPLDRDDTHRHYDRDAVERFWHILSICETIFTRFRADFIGKCSPVHFFWGSICTTTTCAPPRIPSPCCSSSAGARTRQRRTSADGIARRSNAEPARPAAQVAPPCDTRGSFVTHERLRAAQRA